jgi:hypothetical protein
MYYLPSRGADSDIDHCLVVAKVRERLAESKQVTQKFDVERFNLKTPYDLEVNVSKRSPTLEILSDSEGINRVWENIKENVETTAKGSLGLYELKQHLPWLDEEHLFFLDQRKQAQLQWLEYPNQSNLDYINNV